MRTIEEIFGSIKTEELQAYKEIIKYCEERVTADEGIPAIIGLSDLNAAWDTVYEGAAADQEFHMLMAAGAMIFASLYEADEMKEKLGNYPGIAPAMSATAELFFHADADGEAVAYREVVKDFVGREKKND